MKVRFVCLWGSGCFDWRTWVTDFSYVLTYRKSAKLAQPTLLFPSLPPSLSPRPRHARFPTLQVFVRQPCFHRASINISALSSFLFFLCCLLFPRSSFLTLRPLSLFLSLEPCLLSLQLLNSLCVLGCVDCGLSVFVLVLCGGDVVCSCLFSSRLTLLSVLFVMIVWVVVGGGPLWFGRGVSSHVVLARVPCARSRHTLERLLQVHEQHSAP